MKIFFNFLSLLCLFFAYFFFFFLLSGMKDHTSFYFYEWFLSFDLVRFLHLTSLTFLCLALYIFSMSLVLLLDLFHGKRNTINYILYTQRCRSFSWGLPTFCFRHNQIRVLRNGRNHIPKIVTSVNSVQQQPYSSS